MREALLAAAALLLCLSPSLVGGVGVECCLNDLCNSTCTTTGDQACFRSSLGGEFDETSTSVGCASPFTRYSSVVYEVSGNGSMGWATGACYFPKCSLCRFDFERCGWPGTRSPVLPPLACACTPDGMRNTALAASLGASVDLGRFCERGICEFGSMDAGLRRQAAYARLGLASYAQLCVYKTTQPGRRNAAYGCDLEPPPHYTLNEPTGSRFVQYFYESWLEVRCRDANLCNDRKHWGSKAAFFLCPFKLKKRSKRCPWDPDPVSAAASISLYWLVTTAIAIIAFRTAN